MRYIVNRYWRNEQEEEETMKEEEEEEETVKYEGEDETVIMPIYTCTGLRLCCYIFSGSFSRVILRKAIPDPPDPLTVCLSGCRPMCTCMDACTYWM